MSCDCNGPFGQNSAYSSACVPEVPYPSVSAESVPSLISNLTQALYGTIQKSVVGGKVVWTTCDPNQSATVFGIVRNPGEGLMCYFLRALQASSIVGATGYQGSTGIGATGYQGSTGAGATGNQGLTGYQGSTGVGLQGATGPANGPTGFTGATGAGATGFAGATGAGATGLAGATGVGATGFAGATGANGQSASFFNYQADTTTQTLPPAGPITNGHILWNYPTQSSSTRVAFSHIDGNGNDIDVFFPLYKNGDTFIIQDQNNSDNYQSWKINGTPTIGSNSYIVIPVTIQGAGGTGITNFSNTQQVIWAVVTSGLQGATGYQGSTGIGATGYQGATGLSGSTGSGATGYQGATGLQGSTGLLGSTGLQGATGSGATGYQGATGIGTQGATGVGTLGGDVTGTSSANTVGKVQNRAIANTAPVNGEAFTWNAGAAQFEPRSLQVLATKVASYTLALNDSNTLIPFNVSGGVNLTIPLFAAVPFPLGTLIYVQQVGVAQVTVVAVGGVTLQSAGSAVRTASQYAVISLINVGANVWAIAGNTI